MAKRKTQFNWNADDVYSAANAELVVGARRVDADSSPPKFRKGVSGQRIDYTSDAWEYLVKWQGYSDLDNTWEPIGNFSEECTVLIRKFWKHVGRELFYTDAADAQISAQAYWIRDQLSKARAKRKRDAAEEEARLLKALEKSKARSQSKIAARETPDPIAEENTPSTSDIAVNEPAIPSARIPLPKRTYSTTPRIKYYECELTVGSALSTKTRLGRSVVAPAISRETSAQSHPISATDDVGTQAEHSEARPMPSLIPEFPASSSGSSVSVTLLSDTNDTFSCPAPDRGSVLIEIVPSMTGRRTIDMEVDIVQSVDQDELLDDVSPAPMVASAPSLRSWHWAGGILVGQDSISLNAKVVESSPPPARSLVIGSFVVDKQDIVLNSFYDMNDILLLTSTLCEPATQFARIEDPMSPGFQAFCRYMIKKQQSALEPAVLDGELVVGYLCVFPSRSTVLSTCLGVHSSLLGTGDQLIVGLLPFKRAIGCHSVNMKKADQSRPTQQSLVPMHTTPDLHLGLRILKVPQTVSKHIFGRDAMICPPQFHRELDTRHMREILNSCTTLHSTYHTSVHICFVHVAAIATVATNLPNLAKLRRHSALSFFLYGSDETVPMAQWGIREIYPFGGIFTVTGEACARNPWGILSLISDTYSHPLWACYVLPEALGMALVLLHEREKSEIVPGDVEDKLLAMVEMGKIALMNTPKVAWNTYDKAEGQQWINDHLLSRPRTVAAIRDHCLTAFHRLYGEVATEDIASTARQDVVHDLQRAQLQPVFLNNYRRYVVLDCVDGRDCNGVELSTVAKFKFEDDSKGGTLDP
ncbi:unnamed protein product [Mycena citricolor]|uniref:Chromo domain-containing protein n=1 Tax=Mycena citricolor TaxID=2018698 RepID=A0AAD2HV29_9AGAR|nr:unnamed protein product [Mycena citricolor]